MRSLPLGSLRNSSDITVAHINVIVSNPWRANNLSSAAEISIPQANGGYGRGVADSVGLTARGTQSLIERRSCSQRQILVTLCTPSPVMCDATGGTRWYAGEEE
ncbi:hypothetical protein CC79DRAFT_193676 [Sarocladium strictum]